MTLQKSPKLLIIDDTPEWREVLCSVLPSWFSNEQAEIVEASSGEDAVAVLSRADDFNLIISDYTMPHGNGAHVFKFLRERGMNIPFILFTALHEYNLAQFAGDFFVGVAPKQDLAALQTLINKATAGEPLPIN